MNQWLSHLESVSRKSSISLHSDLELWQEYRPRQWRRKGQREREVFFFFLLYAVAKHQWLVWQNLNEEPQSRGIFGEEPRPKSSGESGEAQWGKMNSNTITNKVAYHSHLKRRQEKSISLCLRPHRYPTPGSAPGSPPLPALSSSTESTKSC